VAKFYRTLTPELVQFIRRQRVFFTATAPSDDGRINLSPKGYDTFRVLDEQRVCYLDFAGSGNETANHIRQNGRITFMWCSFDTRPLILRVYCYGELVERTEARFLQLMREHFATYDPRTVRRIVLGRVESAQTSCGYGVPLFEYRGERKALLEWSRVTADKGELDEYIEANSQRTEEKFPLQRPPLGAF